MLGTRIFRSQRAGRVVKNRGRGMPLRLLMLERRDQPAASVLPALANAAVDFRHIAGLTPAIVRQAYGFDAIHFNGLGGDGNGQTIAIITAYHNPNIQRDLDIFNDAFGLPDIPLFHQVTAPNATINSGWAAEAALDVQYAHAIAPGANILLVESASDSVSDMISAVDFARQQPGVSVVSMSWGANEFRGQTAFDSVFATPSGHAPVSFVAASGDFGASSGAMWPASSPNVLAVGGTRLHVDANGNYASETAWAGSGGGYSGTYTQTAIFGDAPISSARALPDVSFAADPSNGFFVYNSVPNAKGQAGWFRIGGTSAGAPQWAGLIAIADQGRALNGLEPIGNVRAAVNRLTDSAFRDVTTGSNGYTATVGFDMATGRGSPVATSVVAQLVDLKQTATVPFVGPIASVAKSPQPGSVRAPISKSVAAALANAIVTQGNLARASMISNNVTANSEQREFRDVGRNQDVGAILVPVIVAPTTGGRAWDEAIRYDNGSTQPEPGAAPAGPEVPLPAPMANAAAAPAAAWGEVYVGDAPISVPTATTATDTAKAPEVGKSTILPRYGFGWLALAGFFGIFLGLEHREVRRRPRPLR